MCCATLVVLKVEGKSLFLACENYLDHTGKEPVNGSRLEITTLLYHLGRDCGAELLNCVSDGYPQSWREDTAARSGTDNASFQEDLDLSSALG
jgi:hypothetical protein